MPIEPFPVTPAIRESHIARVLCYVCIKVFVLVELQRNPVKPLKINLHVVCVNQKPVVLLEYLIKTYTNEGETVLDFCMGSGSTGVAALNTDRNFIGIEKDSEYFKIAKERIKTCQEKLVMKSQTS